MQDPVTTVFLDRDGTINRKAPVGDYVKSPAEFEFLPGAVAAVRELSRAGLRIIVVTNQRGIALGRMTEDDLERIHQHMLTSLAAEDARVDRIYHCPHERGQCRCRKPDIGMLLKAQSDFPGIDFARSVIVGDSVCDVEAGRRVGCRGILVSGAERRRVGGTVPTLLEAARLLVS